MGVSLGLLLESGVGVQQQRHRVLYFVIDGLPVAHFAHALKLE